MATQQKTPEYRFRIPDLYEFMLAYRPDPRGAVDFVDHYLEPKRRVRIYRDGDAFLIEGSAGDKRTSPIGLDEAARLAAVSALTINKKGIGHFFIDGQEAYAEMVNGDPQFEIETHQRPASLPDWEEIPSVYDWASKKGGK